MAREKFTYTTKDGRTLEWTGPNVSICTKCGEIFNSVAAFDAHIKRKGKRAKHDYSWMPRNARGYLITSEYDGYRR